MILSACGEVSELNDSMPYLDLQVSGLAINMQDYSAVVRRIRQFFEEKGWYEVHNQSRLSILAASVEPSTIVTYNYAGEVWPLPQTGQLWLDHELLSNPGVPGVFCMSASYGSDTNPVVEFESRGTVEDLIVVETELLVHLGFGEKDLFVRNDYSLVEGVSDERLGDDTGPIVLLDNLPNYVLPFWNMKQSTGSYTGNMEVVLLHGREAIRSAARATSKEEMIDLFYKIKEGDHANILFSNFTKARVLKELDKYLHMDMVDRCGGTIGVTEMIWAMKRSNILYKVDAPMEGLEIVAPDIEPKSGTRLKRAKSRCWGLPVAAKKHSASIGSLLVVAATSGGEKAIELAINSI